MSSRVLKSPVLTGLGRCVVSAFQGVYDFLLSNSCRHMLPLPEKSGLYYIILLYEMQDREKIQQKNYGRHPERVMPESGFPAQKKALLTSGQYGR